MFCYQCEQTAKGEGCTKIGVCGKQPDVATLILSGYEQKAVAILLTLVYLGIRNIRLGPSLPAFITPGILDVLVEKLNIIPITTPDEDLKAILG